MRIPHTPRLSCGLLLLGCFLPPAAFGATDPIAEVGKTASEWVKTRAETVRLEKDWEQDRVMLESTVTALKERAVRLQESRDHLLASTAEGRAELASFEAKLAEAKQALASSEQRLRALTERVQQLRPRLPPRLAEALEMSYRSLDSKELSPGERMQLVMIVLNRCAQFNLDITHGEEVLTLPGEPAAKSVEVIYWGLSHGYALDRAGAKVWLGAPGPEGWRWEPIAGAAPAVVELLAVRRDEADPRLIRVPAKLDAAR
ncbi:MAG: hypothetical protein QG602_2575 [Verrucomicrobiota bacterium]|nr:hypothetical protein [Verrucomicrobiota bacterium]